MRRRRRDYSPLILVGAYQDTSKINGVCMMTKKEFFERAEAEGWSCDLVNAFLDQIGGWEEFEESARDIFEHGANGNFQGFTYSYQMDNLRRYAPEIMAHLMAWTCEVFDMMEAMQGIISTLRINDECDQDEWREAMRGDWLICYALESLAETYIMMKEEEEEE